MSIQEESTTQNVPPAPSTNQMTVPRSPRIAPSLRRSFVELVKYVTPNVLADIVSKLHAIRAAFTGDGAGLSGGIVVDMFITAYLSKLIPSFEKHHSGESDCKILGLPLSIKKIGGKSTIALDWSKNKEDSKPRERFGTDVMIINLHTEQWWKKTNPQDATEDEKAANFFFTPIKSGIYFVSQAYCKENVQLSSNNKTNSLIEAPSLYKMLKASIAQNMVIEFPTEFPTTKFNILDAFGF